MVDLPHALSCTRLAPRSRGRAVSVARRAPPPTGSRGPAALSGDWRRFLHLTLTLALTDWKLRFFGSALGYFWSLLRPLLLFGILYSSSARS